MRRVKKIVLVLGTFALVPIVAFVAIWAASNVYVSGGMAASLFEGPNQTPVWQLIEKADQDWLPSPQMTRVERVGIGHLPRNLLFLVAHSALYGIIIPIVFFGGVLFAVYGLFTANWDYFGAGLLASTVGTLFAVLAFIVMAFVCWLFLILQPCTPAYATLWILVGLPLMGLGMIGGCSPTVIVIVIIRR